MKALTLIVALIGVVAAEVFLDERFSDGGKSFRYFFRYFCPTLFRSSIFQNKGFEFLEYTVRREARIIT